MVYLMALLLMGKSVESKLSILPLGVGKNLGSFGAVSVDVTQAKSILLMMEGSNKVSLIGLDITRI